MNFYLEKKPLEEIKVDFAVKFCLAGEKLRDPNLQNLLELNYFNADMNETLVLTKVSAFKASRLLLIGLGDKQIKAKGYLKIMQSVISVLNERKAKSVAIDKISVENKDQAWIHKITAFLFEKNNYQIEKVGLELEKKNSIDSVKICSDITTIKNLDEGVAIAKGISFTRKLADMPANICTPSYLADVALEISAKYNIKSEILDEEQMQDLGMNSLLSVAKGSIEKPKFITLSYLKGKQTKPIVLIGKGVTFDTGGISLKPGASMDEMKYDMCGAASVIGTLIAVAQMKLNINLIVIIPAVENMPAHNASKPGDVVKSMSGQTIEILNTDAEGRLILCDALTYCKRFNPEVVIDVATLTGAVIVALGKHHSGVMTNDNDLFTDLNNAGNEVLDTIWRLPLDDEYDELLKSNFADMANIGSGREAGTVTAGCFLARFIKDYSWAHLDIAGTAWVTGANKGATGRPVALLTQYIINKSP